MGNYSLQLFFVNHLLVTIKVNVVLKLILVALKSYDRLSAILAKSETEFSLEGCNSFLLQ